MSTRDTPEEFSRRLQLCAQMLEATITDMPDELGEYTTPYVSVLNSIVGPATRLRDGLGMTDLRTYALTGGPKQDDDVFESLYAIADDHELSVLDELRARAGITWEHRGCWTNMVVNGPTCEQCDASYYDLRKDSEASFVEAWGDVP